MVSDAAVKLTTAMLDYRANNPTAGWAEALRRSMLALVNKEQKPHYAHPLFWAPFVVVGEGGLTRSSECPLWVISRRFAAPSRMSAFGGKADVNRIHPICPLIAKSGHKDER